MSSTLNSNAKFWEQFFLDAGIQPEAAMDFAVLFNNHHLSKDMLLDITKEHLIDMGINIIGDIILIQKHAKFVHNKGINQLHTSKYTSSNSNASSTTLLNIKDENKNIAVTRCEPMDIDIKDSKNMHTMIPTPTTKAYNAVKNESILKKDKQLQVDASKYSPIIKASAKEDFLPAPKQRNNQNAFLARTTTSSSNHNFKVKSLRNNSNLRPGLKSLSQGIFANEDRPYRDILGKTFLSNSIKERIGNPTSAQNSSSTPFVVTVGNFRSDKTYSCVNKRANFRREIRVPNIDRRLPKVREPVIIRRGMMQKSGLEVTRAGALRSNIITKNQSSVFSRLGQKSAKERLG